LKIQEEKKKGKEEETKIIRIIKINKN